MNVEFSALFHRIIAVCLTCAFGCGSSPDISQKAAAQVAALRFIRETNVSSLNQFLCDSTLLTQSIFSDTTWDQAIAAHKAAGCQFLSLDMSSEYIHVMLRRDVCRYDNTPFNLTVLMSRFGGTPEDPHVSYGFPTLEMQNTVPLAALVSIHESAVADTIIETVLASQEFRKISADYHGISSLRIEYWPARRDTPIKHAQPTPLFVGNVHLSMDSREDRILSFHATTNLGLLTEPGDSEIGDDNETSGLRFQEVSSKVVDEKVINAKGKL